MHKILKTLVFAIYGAVMLYVVYITASTVDKIYISFYENELYKPDVSTVLLVGLLAAVGLVTAGVGVESLREKKP